MAADRSGTTTGGDVPNLAPPPVSLTHTTTPRGTGEPLTVDTDALRAAAARYDVQASVFHAVADAFSFLRDKPPIKRSWEEAMGDETAEKFLPPYLRTADLILTGLQKIGTALEGVGEGIVLLAQGHEKTEDNNVQIARDALVSPARSGTAAPDVRQGAVVPGTTGELAPPPPTTTGPRRKGVVSGGGTAGQRGWSGVGIPSVPQELVNARGEKIGVLAPLGADVPGGGKRVFLTGADGQPRGFFRPYGEHTLEEAVRGELWSGVLLPPPPSREEPPVDPDEVTGPVSFPAERGIPVTPVEEGLWAPGVAPDVGMDAVPFSEASEWSAVPPGDGVGALPVSFPAERGIPVTPVEEGLWAPAVESDVFPGNGEPWSPIRRQ